MPEPARARVHCWLVCDGWCRGTVRGRGLLGGSAKARGPRMTCLRRCNGQKGSCHSRSCSPGRSRKPAGRRCSCSRSHSSRNHASCRNHMRRNRGTPKSRSTYRRSEYRRRLNHRRNYNKPVWKTLEYRCGQGGGCKITHGREVRAGRADTPAVAICSQPPSMACAVDPVRDRRHLVRDVGRRV